MAEKTFIKEKKIIRNYFKEKEISLKKIILFGSHASKENTVDSDIDFIIVSDDFNGLSIYDKARIMGSLDWQLVRETKTPYDILYYSDEEWKNSDSLILNEAKKDGKLIYP